MSEIPKNRRKKSKLDIQHNIYKIRKELTSNLMETFAYSENWKIMSWPQIYSMNQLYLELFNKPVTWKKGHGRLKFMMNHKPNKERMVKQ